MDIETLLRLRFGTSKSSSTEWYITPLSLPALQRERVPFNTSNGAFIPPEEWWPAHNLRNFEKEIAAYQDEFRDGLTLMTNKFGSIIEHCTGILTPDEYRIIRVYGSEENYRYFVLNHRFGDPPRGKEYRSNVRGWEWAPLKRSRPDNAIHALERKIQRTIALGADPTELQQELVRRKECIAKGIDPLAGIRWPERVPPEKRRGPRGVRPAQPKNNPYTLPLDGDGRPIMPPADVIPLRQQDIVEVKTDRPHVELPKEVL